MTRLFSHETGLPLNPAKLPLRGARRGCFLPPCRPEAHPDRHYHPRHFRKRSRCPGLRTAPLQLTAPLQQPRPRRCRLAAASWSPPGQASASAPGPESEPDAGPSFFEAISRDTRSSQHAGHAARRICKRNAAGTFSGHCQRSRRICEQKCGWPSLSETTSGSSRSSHRPGAGVLPPFSLPPHSRVPLASRSCLSTVSRC